MRSTISHVIYNYGQNYFECESLLRTLRKNMLCFRFHVWQKQEIAVNQ
jgi:hypothetical protein